MAITSAGVPQKPTKQVPAKPGQKQDPKKPFPGAKAPKKAPTKAPAKKK